MADSTLPWTVMAAAPWVLGALLIFAFGLFIGWLLAAARLKPPLTAAQTRLLEREKQFQRLENEHAQNRAAAQAEFQVLAERILRGRTEELQKSNNQNLDQLLTPLKEQMGRVSEEIKTTREKSAATRAALEKSLETAVTELRQRTEAIGKEADALARAFRGESKTQGNWGELVLDGILEQMGLAEGTHYDSQKALRAPDGALIQGEETGRLIPDILLHYADGRSVVVDSKVSLAAYTDFINAAPDSPERADALKQHLDSTRKHINDLAGKNYTKYVKETGRIPADFAILFIPNEGSFHALIQAAPALWEEAFRKNILLVSPVLLPPLLHLIHIGWVRVEQEKNQEKILEAARQLLERIYHFYEHFDRLGAQLENARTSYHDAAAKLRDGPQSAVKKGEELRALGVPSPKRPLPSRLTPD